MPTKTVSFCNKATMEQNYSIHKTLW